MKIIKKTTKSTTMVSGGGSNKGKGKPAVGALPPPPSGSPTPLSPAKGVKPPTKSAATPPPNPAPAKAQAPAKQQPPVVSKPPVVAVKATAAPPVKKPVTPKKASGQPKAKTAKAPKGATQPSVVTAQRGTSGGATSAGQQTATSSTTSAASTSTTSSWSKNNWGKVLIMAGMLALLVLLVGYPLVKKVTSHYFHNAGVTNAANVPISSGLAMIPKSAEVAKPQKQITESESHPQAVVPQVRDNFQQVQPNSIVMVATNAYTSNSVPSGTIEGKSSGGQVVGIIGNGNRNFAFNMPITISSSSNGTGEQTSGKTTQQSCWPPNWEPTRTFETKESWFSSGLPSFQVQMGDVVAGEIVSIKWPAYWVIIPTCSNIMSADQVEVKVNGKPVTGVSGPVTQAPEDMVQGHEMRIRLNGIQRATITLTFNRSR